MDAGFNAIKHHTGDQKVSEFCVIGLETTPCLRRRKIVKVTSSEPILTGKECEGTISTNDVEKLRNSAALNAEYLLDNSRDI